MSLVLIGKDLLLEAKQRTNGFQVYIYIYKSPEVNGVLWGPVIPNLSIGGPGCHVKN